MGKDWSDWELNLIVEDYFSMLFDELDGKPINKTANRKRGVGKIQVFDF